MKKTATALPLLGIVLALLVSCANPAASNTATIGMGSIRVMLPALSSGRDLLTPALAQSNVTGYSVYVFNPASSASLVSASTAAGATSASLNVPAGTGYSVIALALGTAPNSYGYLLGSGEVQSVSVTSGYTTTVAVTLEPVDFSFTVTSPPALGNGSSLTFNMKGNAGISSLQVLYFGWYVWDTSTTPPTSAGNGGISPTFTGTTSNEYSSSFTVSLGFDVTATTNGLSLTGADVFIEEGSVSYELPFYYFYGAGACPPSLKPDYFVGFSPAPPTGTGLSVSVGWGSGY